MRFTASGSYQVKNQTDQPISDIHISDSKEAVDEVSFDRSAHATLTDKKHFYAIYKIDPALKPGESMRISFRSSYTARGFKDGNERPEIAANGTFFDRDYFPVLGYAEALELDDPARRREEKTAAAPRPAGAW